MFMWTGRRLRSRAAAPYLVVLMAIAACGAEPAAERPTGIPSVRDGGTTGGDPASVRYTATGTVLQDHRHGPQLCMNVATSYPPQCGGADVVGWDWKAVEFESSGETKWGEYRLVGTWDGKRLTLTEPPGKPAVRTPSSEDTAPKSTSPCPEPPEGWKPVDPRKATDEAMHAAMTRASTAPEFAGGWIDQGYLSKLPPDAKPSEAANDPARYVLNLRFTGDLAGRERWIREVWGGALCVSGAEHSQAELTKIQNRLAEEVDGLQGSGISVVDNRVEATVFVITDELQHTLDTRYGPGVVVLRGFLRPVK